MPPARSSLLIAALVLGFTDLPAQDEVLVNEVGTKLGLRSAFMKDCRGQWSRDQHLAIFEQEKFCECMLPIVLASPAVARSRNAKVLDAVDLQSLLNNSPTAFDDLAKCSGLNAMSVRLAALGEEVIGEARRGCAEEVGKDPELARSGTNAVKLCDCLVGAIVERDLTLGDLQKAMDPNSPLFNEVFAPCAIAATTDPSAGVSSPNDISGPTEAVTLLVISMGKVHKVKVRIAGTEQYFIIDSGAEDCIISASFAAELRKAGAIDTLERLAPRDYMIADGSRATYPRHVIHGFEVGPFKVDHVVAASIDQNVQYLLGKSFLNKFKEWRIDETAKTLTLLR